VGISTSRIQVADAKYAVSMSPVHDPLQGKQKEKVVGKFRTSFDAWSLVYGWVPLQPEIDVSSEINQQVARAQGKAIVNLDVTASRCAINAFPILSLLPFWPSCLHGRMTGDIVAAEQ
jgi:hypothetical protein